MNGDTSADPSSMARPLSVQSAAVGVPDSIRILKYYFNLAFVLFLRRKGNILSFSKVVNDFFGERVLTDEKSGQNILRFIFNPTHHLFFFVLTFLLLEWLLSGNAVVGNIWSVGSGCFLAKTHLRYLEVCKSTLKPSQLNQLCRHDKGENHGVNKMRRLQHAGEESSLPPRKFSCITPGPWPSQRSLSLRQQPSGVKIIL